ncbi:MAG TPA: beta-L-arabinofuranosidase domain-containing protein [Candidatus Acidoferrales bacterium]|jgi:DUF1680 family protein|nr:beta-L-arabinofuranosidase domain-containing protein [Candidatus Acidoferrales bacterium]
MFEPGGTHFTFFGRMGERIRANQENWFKVAPIRNPRMVGVFQERKTGPPPSAALLPWVGEYVGKYLIGAIQALRLSGDAELRDVIARVVRDLIDSQGDDGYLGPFGPAERIVNPDKWDLWGHYHCLLGLLRWHQDQNDSDALAACRRAADFLCGTFLGTGIRVADARNPAKNEAVAHIFALLFRATGQVRYLQMAQDVEADWARVETRFDKDGHRFEDGGNYVDGFQHDEAFYKGREPRWESLHDVQALVEFYELKLDWQPWFPLGPNVFPADSPVTALSTKPGGTSLYVAGFDGQVWSTYFDPQNLGPPERGGWQPWFALGPNVFPADSQVTALSTKPGGTSLYVLGLDGQVWSSYFDPQHLGPPERGGWQPWFALGPNVFPARSPVMALSTKPGGTSLYLLGLDGQVWSTYFDPQNLGPPERGGWQPWFALGPNVFSPGSPVTALSTKPGGTSLYVLGLDGQVWSSYFDPQHLGPPERGGWQPWFPLGPNIFPAGSRVMALSTKPGGASLYALGFDGQVWSTYFDPQNLGPPERGGWQRWFLLGPYVFPPGTPVTALSTKPGGASLYALGLDGQVWSAYFDPRNLGPPERGGWQPWLPLGPNVFPAGSRVTALSTKPGGTSLYVLGFDGHVWSTYFDPQNLGRERYHRAFTRIWRSILESDRHVSGGFSSLEAACGNPFDPRPIETCATIAWMCLTLDMLRLTEEAGAADELELSTWNAVLGSQSPDATWWTYDTPMGGISTTGMAPLGWPFVVWQAPLSGPPHQIAERCPTLYDLRWQEDNGVDRLSCCALNGPRGLAMLSEWAVMRAGDGLVINYYGPGEVTGVTPAGNAVLLSQNTDYPIGGAVRLTVSPQTAERFVLRLRIPGWSNVTHVTVNGQPAGPVQPGSYLALDRIWKSGDVVEVEMDMSPRFVPGGRRPLPANSDGDAIGRMAIYRGPLLLAYDSRFDRYSPAALPVIDRGGVSARLQTAGGVWEPLLLLRFPTLDGQTATLCDFASAGTPPWVPSRRWQLSRSDGTVLAPGLTLKDDGTIQGSTHPNETRWGFEDTRLTFYGVNGSATTRFTPVQVPNDRTRLEGKFLPDPTITHVLSQLDSDVTDTIWEFVRADAKSPIRLEPYGRIHGYQHVNEACWKREGDTLMFCDQEGRPTTRFTTSSRVGEHREIEGHFSPQIVHQLRELDLGWVRGTPYVSWLPAPALGAVTALSTKSGGVSLFVLGSDGKVWSTYFDPQSLGPPERGGWQPWFPLGPNVFPAGSGVTVLSTKPGGTSLYVLGLDGQVWSTYFDPQHLGPPERGGWQPWFPLGPNVFPPGSPVTALSTKPGGTSLYLLGFDGQVWSTYFDPQNLGPPERGGWQWWFPLGPNVFPAGSRVTVLSTKPGGASLYVLGFDGQVWSTYFDPQNLGPPERGGWQWWVPLGPNVFPTGSPVTALSTKPGGTSLYVFGFDGQVWSTYFDPQSLGPPERGGWQPWFALGPNTLLASVTVAAVSTAAGRTSLYVSGMDRQVWSRFFPDSATAGEPTGWFALGGPRAP